MWYNRGKGIDKEGVKPLTNRKSIHGILLFTILISTIFCLCSCAIFEKQETKDTKNIVGKWEYSESADIYYIFEADGTGYQHVADSNIYFSYSISSGTISMSFFQSAENSAIAYSSKFNYELKDDTLNIKDTFGADNIYHRA